ncbi:MAG: hypothetical protein AAFU77_02185 [Myxococcota bacterium]
MAADVNCQTHADCAVKNVGNCCGYFPRCVNAEFEPDPAAVKRHCEEKGMVSTCGFVEIASCRCTAGRCTPSAGALE